MCEDAIWSTIVSETTAVEKIGPGKPPNFPAEDPRITWPAALFTEETDQLDTSLVQDATTHLTKYEPTCAMV